MKTARFSNAFLVFVSFARFVVIAYFRVIQELTVGRRKICASREKLSRCEDRTTKI